jgi:CheY-like chemotaxis protein
MSTAAFQLYCGNLVIQLKVAKPPKLAPNTPILLVSIQTFYKTRCWSRCFKEDQSHTLEGYYHDDKRFEVYTYNNPLVALSEFKPHFYDLLLTDINLPDMNGFQFSQKILELDVNVRVCFISAGEVNIEALREIHPKFIFGCFIKKPVSIDYLIKRLRAELD